MLNRLVSVTTVIKPISGEIDASGGHVQVYLNDTLYIDHQDETFTEGYVGVSTRADAVTEFDDLEVKGIPDGAK